MWDLKNLFPYDLVALLSEGASQEMLRALLCVGSMNVAAGSNGLCQYFE